MGGGGGAVRPSLSFFLPFTKNIWRQPKPENSWPCKPFCCGCPFEKKEEKNWSTSPSEHFEILVQKLSMGERVNYKFNAMPQVSTKKYLKHRWYLLHSLGPNRIYDVDVGWAGAVGDARIWRRSEAKTYIEGRHLHTACKRSLVPICILVKNRVDRILPQTCTAPVNICGTML